MTTPFTDKPTLVGDLVTLRPIRATDADTIDHLIRDDGEIAFLTGSIHRSTEQPTGMPIEDLREIYADGLGSMGLHRIALEVYDVNPRARHVYEKVGFVYELTFRTSRPAYLGDYLSCV